jgi:hypothetical protein
MNQKEKIEKIKEFRLIDDVFFQSSERNIYGRSVRLDALCTLGDALYAI